MSDQVARVESLLWRVAELEPFAGAAHKLEQEVQRKDAEIAGHLAMHHENAEELRKVLAARDAEIAALLSAHSDTQNELDAARREIARLKVAAAQRMRRLRRNMNLLGR